MPYLYDGIPDKPAWLRRWLLRRATRSGIRRDMRRVKRGEPVLDEQFRQRVKRSQRWFARRKAVLAVVTDPSFTFLIQLVAGPLVAVQIDRLTRSDGSGSVFWLAVGSVLLALSVWFARTRDVMQEAERDYHESTWLETRLDVVLSGTTERIDEAEQAACDRYREVMAEFREVTAELREIRARID